MQQINATNITIINFTILNNLSNINKMQHLNY